MDRSVVLLACCVACTSVPRAQMIAEVERPASIAQLSPPVMFGPVLHPATAFDEPIAAAPSTAARDQIFAALVEAARDHGEPQRDLRLDVTATELAEFLARGGVADAELLELAYRSHGIVEPANVVLTSSASTAEAALAELLPELGDALHGGNVHVGIGGGEGTPFVVLVIHTALVTLPPTVPRALPPRGSFTFSAPVDPLFHAPRVTVTYDDDPKQPVHPTIARVDLVTFSATVECGDHRGTLWLLVEGFDSKNTAQRLALVPVSCGVALETSYRVEPRANTHVPPQELERRLAAIINRERASAGVPVLRGDLRADYAAGYETAYMLAHRSVEHELAHTTTIGRLSAQGLLAPFTFEATLHAKDLATAAEILLNVRGYRELLAQPDPTHLGISVRYDEEHQLYIALELVSVIPVIDTARIEAVMLDRISKRRPDQREPLRRDPILDKLAAEYATNRVRGWSDKVVTEWTQKDLALHYGPYRNTWRALTLLLADDVDKVDLGPTYAERPWQGVGLAAIQAPRNGALAGRTFVIVLYGSLAF